MRLLCLILFLVGNATAITGYAQPPSRDDDSVRRRPARQTTEKGSEHKSNSSSKQKSETGDRPSEHFRPGPDSHRGSRHADIEQRSRSHRSSDHPVGNRQGDSVHEPQRRHGDRTPHHMQSRNSESSGPARGNKDDHVQRFVDHALEYDVDGDSQLSQSELEQFAKHMALPSRPNRPDRAGPDRDRPGPNDLGRDDADRNGAGRDGAGRDGAGRDGGDRDGAGRRDRQRHNGHGPHSRDSRHRPPTGRPPTH